MSRSDGRANDQLRPIKITEDYVSSAEASVLIEVGKTRVLCCATIDTDLPRWMKGSGKGWVTAEYNLLPRSTSSRVKRERDKISGRTQEIQRLIGRSLRGICDLAALGEKQIILDCDVIEADGGTRTASVVGAFIALGMALKRLPAEQKTAKPVLKHFLSATSVGILEGQPLLDLCYVEDSKAEVDMNVVMTQTGDFVEIQGTGEESVFSMTQLQSMLALAEKGCRELHALQKKILGETLP